MNSPDHQRNAVEVLHQATSIYTTDSVVEGLLDRLGWPGIGLTLLDPSAGDGAFLRRALARLRPAPGDRETAMRICGYEIHPGAAAECRTNLAQDLINMGWSAADAIETSSGMVIERDFLIAAAVRSFSVIAGNPPYLRFARLPTYFKLLYGSSLQRHALADILHAFLDRCCEILPADGAIGLVTADRWLFNETAAGLRAAIGLRVGLRHVGRLDPATSFYRPKLRRTGSLPRVHPVEIVLARTGAGVRTITAAPISPDGEVAAVIGAPTLADIAEIRIAPWLGPHGIFVVDPLVAASLRDADLLPAIDTDDIDPVTDRMRAPKRFAIRTVRNIEPAAGELRDHLHANRDRMPPRAARGAWWMPPEAINIPLDKPYLLIPRIARRLRVVEVPAGVLALNHNLTIVSAKPGVTLADITAILICADSQEWIRRNAPRLENGFYSITTKLLRRLPIRVDVKLPMDAAA